MSDPELHPNPPDEFDRRDDQGMWTIEQTRDGPTPQPGETTDETPRQSDSSRRRQIPVRGHVLTQIADNDVPAQEIHSRMAEESALRQTVTDQERAQSLEGIEEAKRLLGYK
jgi:hypothetical protein